MFTATVCLFQIIQLVNTDIYKSLYGNDPLRPNIIQSSVIIIPSVIITNKNREISPPPKYFDVTMTTKNNISKSNKNLLSINKNSTITQQYRNWYANELINVKRFNVRY